MNPFHARSISTSHPRNLLLTIDAFGTLFYPRPSVPVQYATTAHEFGLSRTAITPAKLKSAFKDVLRAQSKRHPNYGRADVFRGKYGGPRQWWEEVIRGSFARVLAPSQGGSKEQFDLPPGMVDTLVDRFAGQGGYTPYEDVVPFFSRMRQIKNSSTRRFDRVVLGVISNSDDRVPAVLKAMGLRVGNIRADQDLSSIELPGFEQRGGNVQDAGVGSSVDLDRDLDLDLVITSYEAGEEKPNRLIFDVAKRQAGLGSTSAGVDETDDWVRVHVGDDYEKDYRGAIDAGWQSYLLPRGDGQQHPARTIRSLVDLIDELKIGSSA